MKNECEGCNDYNACWLSNIQNCPCRNCLVKSMCRSACELYSEFENAHFANQELEYTKEYEIDNE